MLKIGCLILSVWSVLNLGASLFVVILPVVFAGKNALALMDSVSGAEIAALSPQLLANANGIAVFANGLNIAFCALLLFAVWGGVYSRVKWAWLGVTVALAAILLAGVAADYVVGFLHPEVNLISGAIIAVGLGLSGWDISRPGNAGRQR